MCSKQKNRLVKETNLSIVQHFFHSLTEAIKAEKTTPAGHMNMLGIVILAFIVVLYLLVTAVDRIVAIIATIFDVTSSPSFNGALFIGLIIILVAAFFGCLLLMHFVLCDKKDRDMLE